MTRLPTAELLADEASLARGRDYFRRGRVLRVTPRADGTVDGVVEGEDFYRVQLGRASWSCSCPMGVQGIFCKHCVAVSLAAAEIREAAALERPSTDSGTAPMPTAASATGLIETQKRILHAFRTRRDLYRWHDVSEYANVARDGVEALREASAIWGAGQLIPTVQKSIASTVRVIHRADDSSGVIGDIIGDLLSMHAELCTIAPPPLNKLVSWLIDFQFDGKQDFFNPDVARYAEALGEKGLNSFGEKLHGLTDRFGPPTGDYDSNHVIVQYNLQRLAVARRDIEGIVGSFGDLGHSYRLHDVAKALIEVDAIDLAISYSERGARHDAGWQAEKCARYWCELLHEHRPHDEELSARQFVFEQWPTASNALSLAKSAGPAWDRLAEGTYAKLEQRHPRELIETLLGLGLVDRAWDEAQAHTLDDTLWTRLVASREKGHPASVLPILRKLIDSDLEVSDARNYKSAVKRLKQLRTASNACGRENEFETVVSVLRDEHRRRPRLLEELRKAGL